MDFPCGAFHSFLIEMPTAEVTIYSKYKNNC